MNSDERVVLKTLQNQGAMLAAASMANVLCVTTRNMLRPDGTKHGIPRISTEPDEGRFSRNCPRAIQFSKSIPVYRRSSAVPKSRSTCSRDPHDFLAPLRLCAK